MKEISYLMDGRAIRHDGISVWVVLQLSGFALSHLLMFVICYLRSISGLLYLFF
jgi:hypothetical protein